MTTTAATRTFVRELLGRRDYAIISELVEPNSSVLDRGCGDGRGNGSGLAGGGGICGQIRHGGLS